MGSEMSVREFFDTLIDFSNTENFMNCANAYERAISHLKEKNFKFFKKCIQVGITEIPDSILKNAKTKLIEPMIRSAALALAADRIIREHGTGALASMSIEAIMTTWNAIVLPVTSGYGSTVAFKLEEYINAETLAHGFQR